MDEECINRNEKSMNKIDPQIPIGKELISYLTIVTIQIPSMDDETMDDERMQTIMHETRMNG